MSLVVDWPRHMAHVDEAMLARWGLEFQPLYERALARLRTMSPVEPASALGMFDVLFFGDSYESSRLLLPELFDNQRFRGDPVAMPITRSKVAVAGADDEQALRSMIDIPLTISKERPPLSFAPLVLREGEWRPIDLDREPRFAFLQPLFDLEQQLRDRPPPPAWGLETYR